MALTHLLDTGWIIRHLRGDHEYTQTIQAIGAKHLGISIITLAELYEGVYRAADPTRAEHTLVTFLTDKVILPITEDICRLFGKRRAELRQQNLLIGDMDLFIASTCVQHKLTLLTTNSRHFERVSGLKLISQPLP